MILYELYFTMIVKSSLLKSYNSRKLRAKSFVSMQARLISPGRRFELEESLLKRSIHHASNPNFIGSSSPPLPPPSKKTIGFYDTGKRGEIKKFRAVSNVLSLSVSSILDGRLSGIANGKFV